MTEPDHTHDANRARGESLNDVPHGEIRRLSGRTTRKVEPPDLFFGLDRQASNVEIVDVGVDEENWQSVEVEWEADVTAVDTGSGAEEAQSPTSQVSRGGLWQTAAITIAVFGGFFGGMLAIRWTAGDVDAVSGFFGISLLAVAAILLVLTHRFVSPAVSRGDRDVE